MDGIPVPFMVFGLEGDLRGDGPIYVSKHMDDVCGFRLVAGFVRANSYTVFLDGRMMTFQGKRHLIRQWFHTGVDCHDGPFAKHEPVWAVPVGVYSDEVVRVVQRLHLAHTDLTDPYERVMTMRLIEYLARRGYGASPLR